MKKILILGGSGFVGTNLISKIIKNKNNKIYATYFKNKKFKRFKNVKYLKGNLLNLKFCKSITKNIDEVYMCAAYTAGANIINKNPLKFVFDNSIMNLNVLESSAENQVKKFIFLSSSIVYPDSKKKMKENDVNYTFFKKYHNVSWMKIYTEKISEVYAKKMKILIIRPANLYGPFDKFDPSVAKVIPSLIYKFENYQKVEVWGNGKEIKDFLFIEDFIEILLKLKNKIKKFDIINVASGQQIKIKDLVEKIKSNYPRKKLVFLTNKPTMISVRKIDTLKLNKLIKFKFKFNINDGIKKTINWYRENLI